MIGPFRGKYSWLSNFHPCRVCFEGKIYRSVEHAYQAAKTTDQNAREMIREVWHPGEAKRIGGILELRPGWDHDVKIKVMLALLRTKFAYPILRSFLLNTGEEELVEVNTWEDTFWGVCRGVGRNVLGQLLMRVRREITRAAEGEEEGS